jgi:O-antigen/teichoic acid export membrane protein
MKIKEKINIFLDKLEKIIKIDVRYLTKEGFWVSLDQISCSFFALILTIIFANLLPKDDFGIFKYFLTLIGILSISSLGGMNTALTQSIARGFEGEFKNSLKTRISWGIFGAIASLIGSAWYFFHGNMVLSIGLLFIAIFIPFLDSLSVYRALFWGRKKFKILSKYNIIEYFINFIFIILILLFSKNPIFILLFYLISYTLIRFILLKRTLKKYPPNTKTDEGVIPYGKHLSVMGAIGTIAKHLDKILVFHFFGAIELAIYFIAVSIPDHITNFTNKISILAFPKFAEKEKKQVQKGLKRKVILFGLVILIIAIIYISLSPIIFKIFFPKFLESVKYSQIFAISLITGISIIYKTFLQSQRQIKKLYYLNTISPVLSIAILLFSIQFGLLGVIIGRVIYRFIHLLFISYLSLKRD